jgi:hypothetical protein
VNNPTLFYALFALSVTTSVQLVGVYLVFASLIIPALATRRHRSLLAAYSVGLTGYLLGLLGSAISDLPTGPVTVWTMAIAAIGFRFPCSPRAGGQAQSYVTHSTVSANATAAKIVATLLLSSRNPNTPIPVGIPNPLLDNPLNSFATARITP